MFMLNECLIHLCDCTWLNVMYILKHLLIKPKKIFEYFSCFWKVFWFEKISQKSKNVQLCILVTYLESRVSSSSCELNLKVLRLIGEWKFQLRKRLWIFFQNLGLRIFGDSFWQLIRESQAQPEGFVTHWRVKVLVVKKI